MRSLAEVSARQERGNRMRKVIKFIFSIVLWILILIICFLFNIWILCGCGTPNNLGGSYTRLYPVTDYMIKDDGVETVYTVEDNKEGNTYFDRRYVYLHDGQDTVIVISSDRDGKALDGAKECYLYLNADKVAERIKEKGE